ncbi:hypothetical protein ANCCAN_10636 [Ancylostoma caninum]|uniref:Uncharacterized protein n=1 Tax=Ancylostoma caninum TaxID=29170 RepID=A0A368GG82_ANCCA|nr:hypothetical protein ANCCAN_10636 [Ancylostoma caninum]
MDDTCADMRNDCCCETDARYHETITGKLHFSIFGCKMRLTLLLLSAITHVTAELCEIKTIKDLEKPQLCTELKLDAEHDVMMSPMLFRKIKTATTYHYFKLCNSTLGSASATDRVYLPKG